MCIYIMMQDGNLMKMQVVQKKIKETNKEEKIKF